MVTHRRNRFTGGARFVAEIALADLGSAEQVRHQIDVTSVGSDSAQYVAGVSDWRVTVVGESARRLIEALQRGQQAGDLTQDDVRELPEGVRRAISLGGL